MFILVYKVNMKNIYIKKKMSHKYKKATLADGLLFVRNSIILLL